MIKILILSAFILGSLASKYCDISENHVLCDQNKGQISPHVLVIGPSGKPFATKIFNQFRERFARGADTRRSRVRPREQASNIMELRYNSQCEEVARINVKYCSYKKGYNSEYCQHYCEGCKVIDNLMDVEIISSWMMIKKSESNQTVFKRLIHSFVNPEESRNTWRALGETDKEFIDAKPEKLLTYALISEVGCAFSLYPKLLKHSYQLYHVTCALGWPLNAARSLGYLRGKPCSNCPENSTCSREFPSLCSFNEHQPYSLVKEVPHPAGKITDEGTIAEYSERAITDDAILHKRSERSADNSIYCECNGNHALCEDISQPLTSLTHVFPVNDLERGFITEMFNDFRSKVASGEEVRGNPPSRLPSAADMKELIYDDKCEYAAKLYVKYCAFNENFMRPYCRKTCEKCYDLDGFEVDFFEVKAHGHDYTPIQALNDTIHVSKKFFQADRLIYSSYYSYTKLNPLLLLISGGVSRVGCSVASVEAGPSPFTVVCFFGGVDRMEEHLLYTEGMPCSRCPQEASCSLTYPALCQSNKENVFLGTHGLGEGAKYCTKTPEDYYSQKDTIQANTMPSEDINYDQLMEDLQDTNSSAYCACNRNHVLCLDPPGTLTPLANPQYPMNHQERTEITDTFNAFRQRVASGEEARGSQLMFLSPAKYMNRLSYNYKCEIAAKQTLKYCFIKNGHNHPYCRHHCKNCMNLDGFDIAMMSFSIVAKSSEPTINITNLLETAINHRNNEFQADDLIFAANDLYLHQNPVALLANADLTEVGCGILETKNGNPKVSLMCAFGGIAGRFIERMTYPMGFSCSECPYGSSCSETFPSLCEFHPKRVFKSSTRLEGGTECLHSYSEKSQSESETSAIKKPLVATGVNDTSYSMYPLGRSAFGSSEESEFSPEDLGTGKKNEIKESDFISDFTVIYDHHMDPSHVLSLTVVKSKDTDDNISKLKISSDDFENETIKMAPFMIWKPKKNLLVGKPGFQVKMTIFKPKFAFIFP